MENAHAALLFSCAVSTVIVAHFMHMYMCMCMSMIVPSSSGKVCGRFHICET